MKNQFKMLPKVSGAHDGAVFGVNKRKFGLSGILR